MKKNEIELLREFQEKNQQKIIQSQQMGGMSNQGRQGNILSSGIAVQFEPHKDPFSKNKNYSHTPGTKKPSRFFYESIKQSTKSLNNQEREKSDYREDCTEDLEEEDSGSDSDDKGRSTSSSNQQPTLSSLQANQIGYSPSQQEFSQSQGQNSSQNDITRVMKSQQNVHNKVNGLNDTSMEMIHPENLESISYSNLQQSSNNPNYPELIKANPQLQQLFRKQFHEIIDKKLKKSLSAQSKLSQLKGQYKKRKSIVQDSFKLQDSSNNYVTKKTIILSLDDCLLKTSIFKEDLPRIDGEFVYNGLNIFVCYRPYMNELLASLKQSFELILWSSSQPDYTEKLLQILDPPSDDRKFVHHLDLSHCQRSDDDTIMIKNIDILLENRSKDDIIVVDTNMHNYRVHLTNGIMIPAYHIDKDHTDKWLYHLGCYLFEFVPEKNVRQKIKFDFQLDQIFEESKQNQAYLKIKTTHENRMQEISSEKFQDYSSNNSFADEQAKADQ
ncbi:nli interacting factor-like phosphatase family protein [Stylonychia lemnae]|uniref:Mitochondrial import inner membrane translocase subunit TIM50 n=1 Tax=Stylonychia lemnae TaxID=5949 RepID=A0A078AZ20_STYLE|nr:nli interacting factor-like phosphatase family protein [Stylonychia lemnae]|eukprot:CDW86447.1 nli interacting factor-like phosphatase family protein [Stylonychia lemnae]